MKKAAVILPAALLLLAPGMVDLFSAQQQTQGFLARFDGGIGADPVRSVAAQNPDQTFANVSQNVVRGVPAANQLWRIADLKANITSDGRVRIRGRGLLVAGGNQIGQSLNVGVFATLICDTAVPAAEHSTGGTAQTDASGDFRIDDTLTSVPADCSSPVLLIRSRNTGVWFAAGIPKTEDFE